MTFRLSKFSQVAARLFPNRTDKVAEALAAFKALDGLTHEQLDRMLENEIEKSRARVMTAAERDMQLVSYVWGNAPEGNQGTRETVRENIGKLVAA